MSVLVWLFPKLLFPKKVATETSRRSFFRTPFSNQRVNGFQTPVKDERHHYYPFPHEFQIKSVGKTFLCCDHKSWDCLLTHWFPMTSIAAAICRIFCTTSNAFISKTADFFWIFYCISEMWIKFITFWKKGVVC